MTRGVVAVRVRLIVKSIQTSRVIGQILNRCQGDCCVVNRDEGLTTVDFGDYGSLTEKEGVGMTERGGPAQGNMDKAKAVVGQRKKVEVSDLEIMTKRTRGQEERALAARGPMAGRGGPTAAVEEGRKRLKKRVVAIVDEGCGCKFWSRGEDRGGRRRGQRLRHEAREGQQSRRCFGATAVAREEEGLADDSSRCDRGGQQRGATVVVVTTASRGAAGWLMICCRLTARKNLLCPLCRAS
ncbi:hypothetical protein BHE74_00045473 [Ensete ventricosum]|nr:hypothetical protein BHE74_00045473 [Ensete ventricosum]